MNILLVVLSFLIILSALFVIVFDKPLYSAFSLIISMILIGVLFSVMNLSFLSVVQVIVYAGAVMVLFTFVIMLLNIENDSIFYKPSLCALFSVLLVGFVVFNLVLIINTNLINVDFNSFSLTAKNLGAVLFTKYWIHFEAISVLLLASLLGSVHLAENKKNKDQEIENA